MNNTLEIDIPSLPSVNIHHRNKLPSVSAIYLVLDDASVVFYVGKSQNLKSRWVSHHRLKMCLDSGAQRIAWIECEQSELPRLEQEVMIRTRPLLNGVPTLEPKLKKREFFGFKTRGSTDWYSAGITAQEALAILALMLNTSDDGVSYASQTVLAETVSCSRPTITKGLHSLLKRGLVFKIEGKRAQYRLSESIGTKLA